jgi:hypothetical protein
LSSRSKHLYWRISGWKTFTFLAIQVFYSSYQHTEAKPAAYVCPCTPQVQWKVDWNEMCKSLLCAIKSRPRSITKLDFIYRMSRKFEAIGELLLFGKIRKNTKGEKLLHIMCFQSQVLEFLTWDEPLRRYTLYIVNSKKLRRCCHVDMTVKGWYVSRAGGSDCGDTGTAGNTKWTKPGKQQRLANCNVNVATS